MKNAVHLITYTERLAQGDISQLSAVLSNELSGLFAGVHLLPFFFPIDGSDAGFDPIDHLSVDSRLGDWQQLQQLSETTDVMADVIVNHMSAQADAFKSVQTHGENSPYWPLFLKPTDVFGCEDNEESAKAKSLIYSPRPGMCFTDYPVYHSANGTEDTVTFWTTFTDNQIDINVESKQGEAYLFSILDKMQSAGVTCLRLDAAGFAIKRAGTSCFMLPETVAFIAKLTQEAHRRNMQTLVEIHGTHRQITQVAEQADYVYDFMLPPLVLNALFNHNIQPLLDWYAIAPSNVVTVLDTHDGIGLLDAGPDADGAGLLSIEVLTQLRQQIAQNCNNESELASGENAENVDVWQVNCSFYSALGCNDMAYLLARAIQFFSPGIPQVYYAGLYAVKNDMQLLQQTGVGRDINRPYLSAAQRKQALQQPVVKALKQLITLRNSHPAFHGNFSAQQTDSKQLQLSWQNAEQAIHLFIEQDFSQGSIVLANGSEQEAPTLLKEWL